MVSIIRFGDRKCRFRDIAIRTFIDLITPQNVGELTSETTFDHHQDKPKNHESYIFSSQESPSHPMW